jgi:transposase
MSKFNIRAGDIAALLARFGDLRRKVEARTGQCFGIISIQEAGLDGFWIHRVLEREGFESYIVDPASIATSRRRRRAKTDRIDGEALVRALLAYKRGEPRVCAMFRVPSPEEEDRRRAVRERKALLNERIRHVNRIEGLLFNQGVSGYEPLNRDRRKRLETLVTGDGRPLPTALRVLIRQIGAVEEARNTMLATAENTASEPALLLNLKGIGPEFAAVFWSEGLSRHFDNRRQVAAYAGLAPTPWQSGQVSQEQGIQVGQSQAARDACSAGMAVGTSSAHFRAYRMVQGARSAKWGSSEKSAIVALARKLLVALWKYVNAGIIIEGAVART